MIVGLPKGSCVDFLATQLSTSKFKKMKRILIIIVAISAIFFASCNGSSSGQRVPTTEAQEPVQPIEEVKPQEPQMTEAEKSAKQEFAFWVKKVEVRPMVIDENDTYGEGQTPGISVSYTFYFTDSIGNTKEWKVYGSYEKTKPTDSRELDWYKKDLEYFNKAKKLYEEIIKIPEGRIYVEGIGDNIRTIHKGVDLKERKIGTATVREDATVELWSEY